MTSCSRENLIRTWLREHLGIDGGRLEPVSGDASFRRYYRIATAARSYILMDAPPSREDCRPFVRITALLEDAGLNVPHLFEVDLDNGLLLLSDLGDEVYLKHLRGPRADDLYGSALKALTRIQTVEAGLAPYDRTLLIREMELFREWFLGTHLGLRLSMEEHALLDEGFETLVRVANEQPRVFVHRDYHSRNLMVTGDGTPGILDYQDAVLGPLTYDLVSLLRDSYIGWPRERVLAWIDGYMEYARHQGIPIPPEPDTFIRWFDLMGVQRQLKVCGIFARLHYRDHKPGYLDDIPLTFSYLLDASSRHPETRPLHQMLQGLEIAGRLGIS